MNFFIDISILPNAELGTSVLLNSLYSNLHKALFELNSNTIGVSFPKYSKTLGNVLRLHGDKDSLNALQQLSWTKGMRDYCNIGDISSIPNDVKFRVVSRIQPTMSNAKLQRLIKRGTIPEEDVKQYKAKMFSKELSNPYVNLVSASNGRKHRRFINFGELLEKPVTGEFDHFGLSKTATVPWF